MSIQISTDLLNEVIGVIAGLAEDTSYGTSVLCDDPRDFDPDPECSTPEECAAHAEACRRFEAGEDVDIPRHYYRRFDSPEAAAQFIKDTPGVAAVSYAGPGELSHVNVQTWGMGTSTIRDAAMTDLRDRLVALLEGGS